MRLTTKDLHRRPESEPEAQAGPVDLSALPNDELLALGQAAYRARDREAAEPIGAEVRRRYRAGLLGPNGSNRWALPAPGQTGAPSEGGSDFRLIYCPGEEEPNA